MKKKVQMDAALAATLRAITGCPVDTAVAFAAQLTYEALDEDDNPAAEEEYDWIIELGRLPYFRLVYERHYRKLARVAA